MAITVTPSKSKDQSGKVANPARGQPNRENYFFPVFCPSPFAPENECDFARRVRQSHPASACSSQYLLRLDLVLTYGRIPPEFRGGVHLLI